MRVKGYSGEGEEALRNSVLNEPPGGVFRHVNLLVPPKNPEAQMGFIIMEPEDTPLMSLNCPPLSTGRSGMAMEAWGHP